MLVPRRVLGLGPLTRFACAEILVDRGGNGCARGNGDRDSTAVGWRTGLPECPSSRSDGRNDSLDQGSPKPRLPVDFLLVCRTWADCSNSRSSPGGIEATISVLRGLREAKVVMRARTRRETRTRRPKSLIEQRGGRGGRSGVGRLRRMRFEWHWVAVGRGRSGLSSRDVARWNTLDSARDRQTCFFRSVYAMLRQPIMRGNERWESERGERFTTVECLSGSQGTCWRRPRCT